MDNQNPKHCLSRCILYLRAISAGSCGSAIPKLIKLTIYQKLGADYIAGGGKRSSSRGAVV